MSFDHSLKKSDATLIVTLTGKLDATSAPLLSASLQGYRDSGIQRVAFLADGLEYLSSAGLRVLLFAKQKLGENTELLFVGASPFVREVIEMTGLGNFMIFQDTYGG